MSAREENLTADEIAAKKEAQRREIETTRLARYEEEAKADRSGAFIGNLTRIDSPEDREGYEAFLKSEIEREIGPVKRITLAYEKRTGLIEFEGTQEEAERYATIAKGSAKDI